jgi:hypothetical protein
MANSRLRADMICCRSAALEGEQGGVGLCLNKAQRSDVRGEPAVRSPGRLLQPVQVLVQEVDVIELSRNNKSSRLAAVDGLREGAMQERVLHIKLMNFPGAGDGEGEHGVDRGRLDHRAEGLIVVNAGSLGEATMDSANLVPLQRAVRVELVLKNSFTGDDVGANGGGHQ